MKVGSEDPEDDIMRAKAIREEIGDDNFLMMDANQKWDVPEAIEYVHSFGNTRHTHARCIIYQMSCTALVTQGTHTHAVLFTKCIMLM